MPIRRRNFSAKIRFKCGQSRPTVVQPYKANVAEAKAGMIIVIGSSVPMLATNFCGDHNSYVFHKGG